MDYLSFYVLFNIIWITVKRDIKSQVIRHCISMLHRFYFQYILMATFVIVFHRFIDSFLSRFPLEQAGHAYSCYVALVALIEKLVATFCQKQAKHNFR